MYVVESKEGLYENNCATYRACVHRYADALPLLPPASTKDLCYRHPHVQNVLLVFDWRHISNVPGAMRVFFLSGKTTVAVPHPTAFDISSATAAEGTEILVEEGIYHVVSFNIDTENILYRNENILSEFEVYTQERMLTLNARKDNRVVTRSLTPLVGTPDWMCRVVGRGV